MIEGEHNMDDKKFEMQYISIGLEIKPLPRNYSPENFARGLLKNISKKSQVSYTCGTNYAMKDKTIREK